MNQSRPRHWAGLLGLVLILAGTSVRADQVWTVTLDTSQLATNYSPYFALDFELTGTDGNTVTVSNFSFGSGGAGPGAAFLTGGTSGDLGSSVILSDSPANFFNDFNQQFTPGDTLTFTADSTLYTSPSNPNPDNFSMVILERYDPATGYNPFGGTAGTSIPTTDSTYGTFFNFDINGPGATTASAYTSSSGDITTTYTTSGAVPEPSSGLMLRFGVMGLSGRSSGAREMSRAGGPLSQDWFSNEMDAVRAFSRSIERRSESRVMRRDIARGTLDL